MRKRIRKAGGVVITFFLGFIVALLLLEILLWLTGAVFQQSFNKHSGYLPDSAKTVVLCVGDSYTFGLGASREMSYPHQLQHILDTVAAVDMHVVNAGQCGENTAQLLDRLPKYIEEFQPGWLIVLTGGNNNWNYDGYAERPNPLSGKLRIVKMFRYLMQEITARKEGNIAAEKSLLHLFFDRREKYYRNLCSPNGISAQETDSINDTTKKNIEHHRNLLSPSCYHQAFLHAYREGNTELSYQIISEAITKFPEDLFTGMLRVINFGVEDKIILPGDSGPQQSCSLPLELFYRSYSAFKTGDTATGLFYATRMAELYPRMEESYLMVLTLSAGGCRIPQAILDNGYRLLMGRQRTESMFDTLAYYNFLYGTDFQTINRSEFLFFGSRQRALGLSEKKSDQWTQDDLEKIISICRNSGIQLIIQTYPETRCGDKHINDIIRKTVLQNNVLLADQQSHFCGLGNRPEFFVADGHCSDKGYSEMALLLSQIILSNNPKQDE